MGNQSDRKEKYLTGKFVSRNENHIRLRYDRPLRLNYLGKERVIEEMDAPIDVMKRYAIKGGTFRVPVSALKQHIKKELEEIVSQEIADFLNEEDRKEDDEEGMP